MIQETERKCILIVEDNMSYLKILKMRLESRGYRTIVTEDGLESLNLVRQEKPDLIICDLMVPRLNGFQVTRIVKNDKNTRHIPIIVLTSRNLEEDIELALKCGADVFINKAETFEFIIEKIKQLLKSRSIKSSQEMCCSYV
ncbi:response regulator [bacterium]|nr:response regulator [bacterium]RQV97819.1 MAG: response regulator [bacterium]